MAEKIITVSPSKTQDVATYLARKILRQKPALKAVILALSGDLGAGKTTFLQGFAKGLGIEEVVNSPTFVILKRFKITKIKPARIGYAEGVAGGNQISKIKIANQNPKFTNFYHFDLYRLENPEEILRLGFEEIISNPENIVAIEWPEKVAGILPKNIISINFQHLEENKREILIRL